LGYLHPLRSPRFRRTTGYFADCRPPPLAKWVHPLVSLPLLQSSPVRTRPNAFRIRAPSLGFAPHRDISWRSPLSAGSPKPASFRPRRFSRPRRLPPSPALRVYFTPQPRPGLTLQGFSLRRSRTTSSVAVALMSFDRTLYPRLAPRTPKMRPRLQGLALRRSP
jgi:hypothetical protein